MRGNTLTRSISLCFLLMFSLVILCSFTLAQAATAPVIQSINPNIGAVGDYVAVNGTGFGSDRGSSYVSFGPFPSTAYSSWSDTQISCKIPDLPGVPLPVTGNVTVTTPNGTSNAVAFTVRKPSPTVGSIWLPFGVPGAVVDEWITGSGFQQGATVQFSGGSYGWGPVGVSNVNVVTDTIVTCRLSLPTVPNTFPPTLISSYRVVVINPDGGFSTENVSFNVSIIPCGGGAGASVGMVGLMMGTLSLAGTLGIRRRRRKTSKASTK